ncbi:MAG: hypothetical protein V8R63_00900 [Thomasclavelia ramosa]
MGYPVVVKPDNGVGAARHIRLIMMKNWKASYLEDHTTQYIMEEFVNGLILSYDGIANNENDVFLKHHMFFQIQ